MTENSSDDNTFKNAILASSEGDYIPDPSLSDTKSDEKSKYYS